MPVTGSAPLLLTGDNQRAASRLAAEAGITDARAGLLPQDKVEAVRALQADGRRVLLVGDGVIWLLESVLQYHRHHTVWFVATLSGMFLNFFVNKYWTFRSVD